MKNLSELIAWLSSLSLSKALVTRMITQLLTTDVNQYFKDHPQFKRELDWIAHEFWFFGVYRIGLVYAIPPLMMISAMLQPVEEQVVSPINGIIILCAYAFGTGLYFDYARKKHKKIPNPFKKAK